uniref:Reverse transcriptase domain-containing protein n=1 Tax=Leptobrachium leishanense TaxID=445787 RepID=A0A8C5Q1A3_9ANUR
MNGIFNLSHRVLSDTEVKVLNKGLKFAPTNNLDKFNVYIDLQRFKRKLSLKFFFLKNPIERDIRQNLGPTLHTPLKNPSKFYTRHVVSNEIKVFKNLIMNDIEKMSLKNKNYNLTKEEKIAIRSLQKDSSITIKPANKGDGIVILSKEMYDAEVLRTLGDETTYEKLKSDPIKDIKERINILLQEGLDKEILNQQEYNNIKMEYTKTPHMYILPKIHKYPTNPPGRPIVAGIDSITSHLSKYVDLILQPIVCKIPSHLKDTLDVLTLLKDLRLENSDILVTCDVNALYSSIPHQMGLKVVEKEISKVDSINPEQLSFILNSINFILKNNYFKFEEDFFIQLKGTKMGTKFALSYANLYMAGWESQFVYGSRSWALGNLLSYKRYIDDIFFVWRGSEENLQAFLTSLDSPEWGIKLDSKWSRECVNFLDLKIYREGDNIKTKTFFKEVDMNTFIEKTSCHNPIWLKGVPKGQFIQLRRNCTDTEVFKQQADTLKRYFIEKGYGENDLDHIVNELIKDDRETLLKYKPKKGKEIEEVRFICDYNNKATQIKRIFKKHWHVLRNDKDLKNYVGKNPNIVFRGARNLKSCLVHNKPKKRDTKESPFGLKQGFYNCGQCLACRSTCNKKGFKGSYHNKKSKDEISIKGILNCFSKNIIYLLECPCGMQYIGRTKRAFNVRLSEHIRNIKKDLKNTLCHYILRTNIIVHQWV